MPKKVLNVKHTLYKHVVLQTLLTFGWKASKGQYMIHEFFSPQNVCLSAATKCQRFVLTHKLSAKSLPANKNSFYKLTVLRVVLLSLLVPAAKNI